MSKKLYVLSDSREAAKYRWMTDDEAGQAQQAAIDATDGNWSWYLVDCEDVCRTSWLASDFDDLSEGAQ